MDYAALAKQFGGVTIGGAEPSVPVTQTTTGIPGGPADMVSQTGGTPTATTRNNQDLIDLQAQIKKGGNAVQMAAWRDALKLLQSRAGGVGGASAGTVDYAALAKQFGGVTAAPSAAPAPVTGPDAIPVEPGANTTATPDKPQGWWDKYVGLQKVLPALASGAVAGAVAPVAGLAHGLFAGNYGTPQGVADASAFAGKVSNALTYQPNNPLTENIVGQVGNVMQNMIGVPIPTLNALGQAAPAATRAVGDLTRAAITPITDLATVPLAVRAAEKQTANVAKSYANAATLDAGQLAAKYGITVNPERINPTAKNKGMQFVAGSHNIEDMASIQNEPVWTNIGKKEMGVPETVTLDSSKPFNDARKAVSGSYESIGKIAEMPDVEATINALNDIKKPGLIAGKGTDATLGALVQDAKDKITAGMSGKKVLENISELRADARATYKSLSASPEEIKVADAHMKIANALEQLIENNVKDPNLLNQYKADRVAMAKTYAYEAATDYNTGKIDPNIIAKLTAKDDHLTGAIADIGKIAGVMPEVARLGVAPPTIRTNLARSGVPGTIGFALGGFPGAVVGAGVGVIGSKQMARKIISPAYQAKNAVPKDYRPKKTNNLGTAGENVNALIQP